MLKTVEASIFVEKCIKMAIIQDGGQILHVYGKNTSGKFRPLIYAQYIHQSVLNRYFCMLKTVEASILIEKCIQNCQNSRWLTHFTFLQ